MDGQVWPILVREDDTIIAGHARRVACSLERHTEIKVLVARGWSPAQCRAFALLDNQIPTNAGWDPVKLVRELTLMRDEGTDPLSIGFSKGDLRKLKMFEDADAEPQLGGLSFSIVVRCRDDGHQTELLSELQEKGLECEAMIS